MNKSEKRRESRRVSAREWAGSQKRSFEPTCVKLPDGVEFFKLEKTGTIRVDFLLYIVGKGNPHADEGMEHFEREYAAHRVSTPDGFRLYACREKCFGKKCAPCDWLKKYGPSAGEDITKSMRAVPRHLWLVNDKPGDVENPLKVFDTNHYNKKKGFGEQMVALINALDEGEDPFALKGGSTFVMTVEEDGFKNVKYNLVTRIDLKARKNDYPKSVMTDAPCLDDCIVDPGYDEVMRLLLGGSEDGEDDSKDAVTTKSKTRKPTVDDDEDADDDMDEEEEKITKKPAKAKSKSRVDEDEEDLETEDNDKDDDLEDFDTDEDDEPAPKKRK